MQGWSHADIALGASVTFVIICVAVLALLLLAAFMPERYSPAHMRVAPWESHRRDDGSLAHELGGSATFREPADPSYVDTLMRVQGRAFVLHRPDPVLADEPEALDGIAHPPVSPARPYSMPLAELVASARRYITPSTPERHAPAHAAPTVDTASGAVVGRHRSPALVAA
jgi:hypothetical protein